MIGIGFQHQILRRCIAGSADGQRRAIGGAELAAQLLRHRFGDAGLDLRAHRRSAESNVCVQRSTPLLPSTNWALTRTVEGERRTLPVTTVPTANLLAAAIASSSRSISDEVRPNHLKSGESAPEHYATSPPIPSEK